MASGEQINQLLAAKRKKYLLVLVLAPWMKSLFFVPVSLRLSLEKRLLLVPFG